MCDFRKAGWRKEIVSLGSLEMCKYGITRYWLF